MNSSLKVTALELLESEYNPYYKPYLDILENLELYAALRSGVQEMEDFINQDVSEADLGYAYANDKWTVAEVLMHLVDTERVFQYRAFRFARNDQTELAGFDQDEYVMESRAKGKSKKQILEEFIAVRQSTIALFDSFDNTVLIKSGIASGAIMSVRALGLIISGHQKHHLKILKNRYL